MEPEQNKKSNKGVLVSLIVLIVALILGYWWWQSREARKVEAPASDETSVINADLEGIDINGLEEEFQSIDVDLEQL